MHFFRKNWLILFLVVFVVLFVGWVVLLPESTSPQISSSSTNRLTVVASFYPIAEFVKGVGGDLVNVETITPAGVEPHEYEPTSQQLASIYQSNLFLFNGGGIDAWASRIATDVSSHGIVVDELSQVIDRLASVQGDQEASAPFDPHFWLDPVMAQKEVTEIQRILTARDPDHANIYAQNADSYRTRLNELDMAYRTGLMSCQKKEVITSHAAFAYLAREYGFEVTAIAGLSPEEEPSAGQLAQISELAKQKKVQYIFFETLVNPKLSQTIAQEVGAKTLVFNPLEGLTTEQQQTGANYFTVMQENLANLKTAMVCR